MFFMPILCYSTKNRRRTIQFRKRNMNGEFALTATPSFCVANNAKTSNVATNQGFRPWNPLPTPRFQGVSWEYYTHKHNAQGSNNDPWAVCFKLRVAFVCSTHKQFNFKSTALGRAYLPEGVSFSKTIRFLQAFFAIFT